MPDDTWEVYRIHMVSTLVRLETTVSSLKDTVAELRTKVAVYAAVASFICTAVVNIGIWLAKTRG